MPQTEPIKIFYCYAREDQALRDDLEKHLTALRRSGKIVTWCDRQIIPGANWKSEISQKLDTADLILLLVSPDFIFSEYCYGLEMKRAYERHKQGEAWVVPVILRPVLWKGTVIGNFQLLPTEGKPVTKWADRYEAFEDIAQGIDGVVEVLIEERRVRNQERSQQAEGSIPRKVKQPLSEKANTPIKIYRPQTDAGSDQKIQRRYSNTQSTLPGQIDRRTLLHKRYVIQRVIGQGGMGAVYQVKDIKRQSIIYALKEMSLSMVPPGEQEQAIENFKAEAKILHSLNHPNLPDFVGFFSENHRYFIVMEYINGLTLEDLLERNDGPFTERQVLRWASQLCDAIEYLHGQKPPLIFRDIKPDNVMRTPAEHIKLIDFGLARFFRPSASHDTQLLGTPGFAPPEQYGRAQTDGRSDIYALGMTLFYLLTNSLSERGFGLKNIRATYPHISPRMAHALETATSLNPEDRYSNIAEFRYALPGRV